MVNASNLSVSQIWIFPIKSCRGIQLESSGFTETGLDWDRQWMIVDAQTHLFLTARNIPRMILLTPTLDLATSTLTLSIPATTSHPASSHTIPLAPPPSAPRHTTFKIWGSTFDGLEVGPPALLSALSAFMGKEVLLICKGDEPRAAGVVEEWRESPGVAEVYGGEEVPSMKWNDMCPVLVVTEASRRDVGNRIKEFAEDKGFAKERWEGKGDSLEIVRWRGNVVVEGVEEAWEEDGWGELRFEGADGNQVDWFVSSRCGRCMLPNVDPESGVRDKVVPDKVLRPFRENQWPLMPDKTCFGVFGVPKPGHGTIRIGDKITVLKAYPKREDGSGYERLEDASSTFV